MLSIVLFTILMGSNNAIIEARPLFGSNYAVKNEPILGILAPMKHLPVSQCRS